MNQQESSDKLAETSTSSPQSISMAYPNFISMDVSSDQLAMHFNSLNQDVIQEPVKYLDMQHMFIEQGNAIMASKLAEYENILAKRDNTIKALYSDMTNSQDNRYVLNNQYMNIIEKTKCASDNYVHLNTNFTNICAQLNRLRETVDSAKNRQKEVTTLVEQTTNLFQEKILNISNCIDDSLNQVNMEQQRAKQEMDSLENRYSLEISDYKTSFEVNTKYIEQLKSEIRVLSEQLNEANIKLNEEKETVTTLKHYFEKELKDMENRDELLLNQYKSKHDTCLNENQLLKDELIMMKNALDENKKQLDVQLNINKEQIELLDKMNLSDNMNNELKIDNIVLKERNEQLEKINKDLVDDISKKTLFQNEMQEQEESKFNDMCKTYDNLLKMQEDDLKITTQKLESHKEIEKELKLEIETSRKTVFNLQEEVKTNCFLVSTLENTVASLKKDMISNNQKLQNNTKEFLTERNRLENEKTELEVQNKEHFKQIEKLTASYMKYKTKSKQLYVEVMRLRYQCSRSEQKKTTKYVPEVDTIEISDDDEVEEDDDDVSIVEFNDDNVSTMDSSLKSISNKIKKISKTPNLKRNSSSFKHVDDPSKKHKTSINVSSSHKTYSLKQKSQVQHNNSLNSSFRKINLIHENHNNSKMEEIINHQKNVLNNPNISISLSPQTQKYKENDAQVPKSKKMFKIPNALKPTQTHKLIQMNSVKNEDWSKPNSPVYLTVPSPTPEGDRK